MEGERGRKERARSTPYGTNVLTWQRNHGNGWGIKVIATNGSRNYLVIHWIPSVSKSWQWMCKTQFCVVQIFVSLLRRTIKKKEVGLLTNSNKTGWNEGMSASRLNIVLLYILLSDADAVNDLFTGYTICTCLRLAQAKSGRSLGKRHISERKCHNQKDFSALGRAKYPFAT